MTVDELMQQAFERPRTPRSPEYKAGCRAFLDFKLNQVAIERNYQFGTAQADAFFAGVDEGHAILRHAQTRCICPKNGVRMDCPRCGQQPDQPTGDA